MSGNSLQSWEQRRVLVQSLTEPSQAAHLAAESLRWLNHLLGRFQAAADVYAVLGSLADCLDRMPQALEGLTAYLVREQAAGRLRREGGGDVQERVAAAGAAAAEDQAVSNAAAALRRAQSALSDVYGPIPEEEGDGRS
jgi:hypothetical protein